MVALKTFENLPEERKAEIITVCLVEFSLNDYQSASLSNIIVKLGLAKGSFYRYFENKSSLYYYLFDYCIARRKINDIDYVKEPPETDFFEVLKQHFFAKIHFDKKHPLESAFLFNVLHEKNCEELGDIQRRNRSQYLDLIKSILFSQIKQGKLRADIDVDLLAFVIYQSGITINEFISHKYQIDFKDNIREKNMLYDLPEKDLAKIAHQMIEIIKNGISI